MGKIHRLMHSEHWWVGTALGLERLPRRGLILALSVVLLVAGGKLLLPAH